MPKCKSCDGDLLRTDAFCGTCGEPVPGGKPVVPIAREPRASGVHEAPEPNSATFETPKVITKAGGHAAAQAAAVVALSDAPPDREVTDREPEPTSLTQTTIREREPSEPAPVLPLHRKKVEAVDTTDRQTFRASDPGHESAAQGSPDGDASVPEVVVPPGPPILASDLLRERMRPRAPGEATLRRVAVGLSTAGIIAALWSGGAHPLTLVALAFLISMLTIGLTPMSYAGRATSLFLAGAVATGVALWQQSVHGIAPDSILLAAATILLSGSLLFRAYYRGARLARVAVSAGVVILGAWFFMSGGHESLIRLDGHWQSWAPASTHVAFGLLALLALMAFMDSTTRAGAHWWAYALLLLYGMHIGLLLAIQRWPAAGVGADLPGATVAAVIAGIVGTTIAGVALAQVLVVAYNATNRRPRRTAA
ncbi:MAG: hypothetical protein AAF500_21080 [Myxococcota bacterium]